MNPKAQLLHLTTVSYRRGTGVASALLWHNRRPKTGAGDLAAGVPVVGEERLLLPLILGIGLRLREGTTVGQAQLQSCRFWPWKLGRHDPSCRCCFYRYRCVCKTGAGDLAAGVPVLGEERLLLPLILGIGLRLREGSCAACLRVDCYASAEAKL